MSITTFAPVPSPIILTSTPDWFWVYPNPCLSIYTFLIWLLFTVESPFSLTDCIWVVVAVGQLLGTEIYSVESNLIISLGGTVNKYFQIYPSPLSPALVGYKSVNSGSSCDALPVVLIPEEPLSIQT